MPNRIFFALLILFVCNGLDAFAESSPLWTFEPPESAATRGVEGKALVLSGRHSHQVEIGPVIDGLGAISVSAWVKPTDLSGFREILRQECGERLLFSFQGNGHILSLGLNVNGYVECDAGIDPGQVKDGRWHYCVGTFDGATMRVYLDGAEIGTLERPGALQTSATAPGFVGSSGGTGEHFQGALDSVSIYDRALTAAEIARVYAAGLERVLALAEEDAKALNAFFTPCDTFAETLVQSRQKFIENKAKVSPDLGEVLAARITALFPEESRRFGTLTNTSPARYVTSRSESANEDLLRPLVGQVVEYKPLTEAQWAKQTADQTAHWREVEAFEARFDALVQQGDAYSIDWIDLVFASGDWIVERPRVQEPVAPYRVPATPETRARTADEARDLIERDWLHQAGGEPSSKRVRDEIRWARDLAARIQSDYPDANFDAELAALDRIENGRPGRNQVQGQYFQVRAVKRSVMFKNPVIDFDRMMFVDMPYPDGSEWRHETRHRLGYMAVPGARLLTLDGLAPHGELNQLMPQDPFHGSFWRPDLSFDATKVLFCFKPHNEKSFHIYEINIDGTGLRQLTDGPYDDLDPIYLPDGHILFSTTRGHTYVRCMPPTNAYPLARCDSEGKDIYIVSRANEPDYLPSVMDDGRVIYTRWEYTDKPLWRAQGLWTMRPDGTYVSTFWGNQSVWPDLLKDARSIPGSRRVMFTGSAHHDWFSGSVGIIDPDGGLNFPHGLTKVTADTDWPESGNGPSDPVESPNYHASGAYSGYYSPYPLSETDFVVSACREGKFVLYLMDVDGNRELIYEGENNIFHALPVRPRPKPPVIPDQVAWPTREERDTPRSGVLFSSNVYQGAPEALRNKAKFLRVLAIEHKTYSYWHKRPLLSTGPVVSGVQSEGVKRVLGTVPIAEGGSVSFEAPSGIPLHFQLLDENHRALQTMRSFTGVMPGESRGCLGCHEQHSKAPVSERSAAIARTPDPITPLPWNDNSVSWDRYVRPALNTYCVDCHQGDTAPDLRHRDGHLGFDENYWLFTGNPAWGAPYNKPKETPPGFGIAGMLMVEGYDQRDPEAYVTPPPMTKLSYTSPLVKLASSGEHYDVKVDDETLRRLILWVDAMAPYRGSEEVRAIPDPEFQGIDWLSIRPEVASAPVITRPGPVN